MGVNREMSGRDKAGCEILSAVAKGSEDLKALMPKHGKVHDTR